MQRVRTKAQEAARVDALDPQRQAVYAWEDSWGPWNHGTLTLAECRWWVEQACAKFGVAAPRVTRHFTREYPWCNVRLRVISMQERGMNAATCLHEAAHQIAYDYFGEAIQDHGRTFFGIYLWLLEWSRIAPPVALRASARARGIRWRKVSPETCKN